MLEIRVQVIPPLSTLDFKKVGQAVHEAGVMVEEVLKASLNGTVIPGMTSAVKRSDLAGSVQRSDLGLFEFSVEAPSDIVSIENGKPPYDMKPGMINGPRSRPLNDGTGRYNIIPFKHNLDDLPDAVAEMASTLTLSKIIGQFMDEENKLRNIYSWGTDTGDTSKWMPVETKPQIGGMTGPYMHKASKGSNMYRFKDNNFITFRTVSSHSSPDSWWHPGTPSNPVMQSVEDYVRPHVEAHIVSAWIEELGSW
ncbi:hypothetical protein ACOJUR_12125 [Alicyclobacillus tolerans]|uniref:hypothetical protein n=1 Tax=Alicyclobacillus tolerans TaxID=90970 RepID=UPI003B7CAA3F